MLLRIAVTVVLLGTVAGAVFGYKSTQEQATTRARLAGGVPAASVTATRVATENWVRSIEATGTLMAIQDVHLASEVTGKVAQLSFDSGQAVSAGTVLVQLDAGEDLAQLAALEAELELARLDNERVVNLRGSPAFSQSQLDRTQSVMRSLAARVERQHVLVDKKTIRAPFDGVLGMRRISIGEIVGGGAAIVSLQSLAPIHVDFTIPERFRSQVRAGQNVGVKVAAWQDTLFDGRITAISPQVDPRSRTVSLRAEIANADLQLQPGMFASVHIYLGEGEPVLTLPRTAISFFAYGESVFVIDQEAERASAHRQPIQVGRTRAGRVEIIAGLSADQQVVLTGHLKLRDGSPVSVEDGVTLPAGIDEG